MDQEYCELGKHFVEEIYIEDYGLVACWDCYSTNKEAQKAMIRAYQNDPVEADHRD